MRRRKACVDAHRSHHAVLAATPITKNTQSKKKYPALLALFQVFSRKTGIIVDAFIIQDSKQQKEKKEVNKILFKK